MNWKWPHAASCLETTIWWKPFLIYIFFRKVFLCTSPTHCWILCWLAFLGNPVQKLSRHNSSETLNKSIWKETWLWQWSQDRMDTSPLTYSIYELQFTDVLVFWFNFQFHPHSTINCRAPHRPVSLTSELWCVMKWMSLLWWIFCLFSLLRKKSKNNFFWRRDGEAAGQCLSICVS